MPDTMCKYVNVVCRSVVMLFQLIFTSWDSNMYKMSDNVGAILKCKEFFELFSVGNIKFLRCHWLYRNEFIYAKKQQMFHQRLYLKFARDYE